MSKARTAQSLTALLLGGALTTAVLTAETPARTDFLAPAADAAPVTELTNVPMTATKDTAEPNTQPSKANQEINVQKNSTEPFRVIALSWKKSAPLDHDARALARFHRDGSWGRWQEIPLDGDQITDEEATRAGSPVFFSDTADGVQLRMTTPKGHKPICGCHSSTPTRRPRAAPRSRRASTLRRGRRATPTACGPRSTPGPTGARTSPWPIPGTRAWTA